MRRALGVLWAGGFLFFFSFYLLVSALPLYARDAGVPDAAIGLVIGCFAFASMLLKPWAGWAADRYGRRPLLVGGAAIFLVASLAYDVARSVLALLLVRLLHGSGMGLFPTAASAVVADLAPPARRGELLGIIGAAANVALALGPVTGMAIFSRFGFSTLFAVSAALAALAVATALLVPETLRAPVRIPLRLTGTLSAAALPPSAIALCLMVSYGAQISFLPIFAHDHGVDPGLFFLVFALVVAAVRGRAGRLSDRLGRVPVAAGGLVLVAVALLTVAFVRSALGLVIAGAFYGVGLGATQPALMAWCVDRVAPEDRGRAMGTYFTAFELGIAGGAMATGFSVAAVGVAPTFIGVAAVAVLGALLTVAAGRRPAARA